MTILQLLTANLAAPSCLSRGRQEMRINTATSHTPALGHAHICTDHSNHCRAGQRSVHWSRSRPHLPLDGRWSLRTRLHTYIQIVRSIATTCVSAWLCNGTFYIHHWCHLPGGPSDYPEDTRDSLVAWLGRPAAGIEGNTRSHPREQT